MRIYILPGVSASISGTDSICVNNFSLAKLRIIFTGTNPWNVTYTDGITPITINGITTSPFIFNSPIYLTAGIRTFTILSASGINSCPANINGSASINVFSKPGTISIIKY